MFLVKNWFCNCSRKTKPNKKFKADKPVKPVCGLICCAICQHKKLLLRKKYKKNGRKAIDRHMAILIYVDSPENQVYRQVNGPPGILSL